MGWGLIGWVGAEERTDREDKETDQLGTAEQRNNFYLEHLRALKSEVTIGTCRRSHVKHPFYPDV